MQINDRDINKLPCLCNSKPMWNGLAPLECSRVSDFHDILKTI